MKNIILIAAIFFVSASIVSAQISVQLIQPNELALSTRDLWNCIALNANNFATEVYLHGTIAEQKDGKVFEIISANFSLATGTTQFNTLNYSALTPEKIIFKAPLYEDYLLRTNSIPRGNYQFCIEVVAVGQQTVLASNCIQVNVLTSTPPYLISPNFGDTICEVKSIFYLDSTTTASLRPRCII